MPRSGTSYGNGLDVDQAQITATKGSVHSFPEIECQCAVPNELINDFIDAFEVAGSKRPSFADMATLPSKIKSNTKGKKKQ